MAFFGTDGYATADVGVHPQSELSDFGGHRKIAYHLSGSETLVGRLYYDDTIVDAMRSFAVDPDSGNNYFDYTYAYCEKMYNGMIVYGTVEADFGQTVEAKMKETDAAGNPTGASHARGG